MTSPVVDILRAKLDEQPIYKRYANTVTSLIATAVNVVWVLISLGVELPTQATVGVAVAIQALGALGVLIGVAIALVVGQIREWIVLGTTYRRVTQIQDDEIKDLRVAVDKWRAAYDLSADTVHA
ncbi:UNVERIFIED_CONTAM: hypothetical protein DES50_102767 [Williamsia faeni]